MGEFDIPNAKNARMLLKMGSQGREGRAWEESVEVLAGPALLNAKTPQSALSCLPLRRVIDGPELGTQPSI